MKPEDNLTNESFRLKNSVTEPPAKKKKEIKDRQLSAMEVNMASPDVAPRNKRKNQDINDESSVDDDQEMYMAIVNGGTPKSSFKGEFIVEQPKPSMW